MRRVLLHDASLSIGRGMLRTQGRWLSHHPWQCTAFGVATARRVQWTPSSFFPATTTFAARTQRRYNSTSATVDSAAGSVRIPDRPIPDAIRDEKAKEAKLTSAEATGKIPSEAGASSAISPPINPTDVQQKSEQQGTSSEARAEQGSTAEEEVKPPLSYFGKLKAMFKSMTLKEIIKQYGIPIAIFYWVFNEVLVIIVTCLLHFNYVSQNSVVDILDALGFGGWIDTKILHTHSFQIGSFSISALLLTNFLVASAFLALFVPVKLPFCIWVYPKLRRFFKRKPKTAVTATENVAAKANTASASAPPAV